MLRIKKTYKCTNDFFLSLLAALTEPFNGTLGAHKANQSGLVIVCGPVIGYIDWSNSRIFVFDFFIFF